MPKFKIECRRIVEERETITFEADNLAAALNMAADAYTRGATEENPHEYRWDDCGDVTELEFTARDESGKVVLDGASLEEAEEADAEWLKRREAA